MYCSNSFGYGHFGHFGGPLFIIILIIVAAVLLYRIIVNNENRVLHKSVAANRFHSSNNEKYCASCGKIINHDWSVCPYCEIKL